MRLDRKKSRLFVCQGVGSELREFKDNEIKAFRNLSSLHSTLFPAKLFLDRIMQSCAAYA